MTSTIDIHAGPQPDPPGFPWSETVGVVPHLLWAGLLLFLLLWAGRERLFGLLGRVEKVGLVGFEVSFRQGLEHAAAVHDKPLLHVDLGRASRRLAEQRKLVDGARILWIDDHPANNEIDMKLLESAGARVDTQTSSDGAQQAIAQVRYDVVISDISRDSDATAGLSFARALAQQRSAPPLIFYVSNVQKPVPADAFGLTDRPDELIHLILDALARRRS